jgi:hypothetical protein
VGGRCVDERIILKEILEKLGAGCVYLDHESDHKSAPSAFRSLNDTGSILLSTSLTLV